MRIIGVRTVLSILICFTSTVHALADEGFCENGFTYTILEDSHSLSLKRYQAVAGTDYSQPLHVPAIVKHDGRKYLVKEIESEAFKGATEVLSVVIDEGIEHIGEHVFEHCVNLEIIHFPASAKYIGGCLFGSCYNLKTIVVNENNKRYDSRDNSNAIIESDEDKIQAACSSTKIPTTVKSIGSHAFYCCNTMEQLVIPEGVERIGFNAFKGCSSLKNITLPGTLTEIEDNAFAYCNSLTSIVIPKNVTNIADQNIFAGCNNLTSVRVDYANLVYDSRSECNGIVRKSDSTLIATCKTTVISEGVKRLGSGCFIGLPIHSIMIPQSVVEIPSSAFDRCYELDEIKLASNNPNYISPEGSNALLSKDGKTLLLGCRTTVIPYGVETIGEGAFSCRYANLVLRLPETIKTIESFAFSRCDALCELIIPKAVRVVEPYAFKDCVNLAVVQILSPIKVIQSHTFSGCHRLSTVNIPEGVEAIERGAFENCKSLEHVTQPSSIKKIHDSAFANCPVSEKK